MVCLRIVNLKIQTVSVKTRAWARVRAKMRFTNEIEIE